MQEAADRPAGRARAGRVVVVGQLLPSPQTRIDREAMYDYSRIGDRLVRASSGNAAVDHRVEHRTNQVPPPTDTRVCTPAEGE